MWDFFSMTCGHFKNMTILGLGISLLCYSRKSRSLAGSVVQWEAPKGLPAVPGWAREGISLLLLRPAFRPPGLCLQHSLFQRLRPSKDCGQQSWTTRPGEPASGRSREDGCPGGFSSLRTPEASALLQKQTFVLPGHRLAYLTGFT